MKAEDELDKAHAGCYQVTPDTLAMSKRQLHLFDTAELRRDTALDQVACNAGESWLERSLAEIDRLPPELEWTGEEIRLRVQDICGSPHHHNAWGALIRTAIRRGLIIPTGKWKKMKTRKSHARKTPVYVTRRWR